MTYIVNDKCIKCKLTDNKTKLPIKLPINKFIPIK